MKILVFDDKEMNRLAAKEQLKDHDVTVVGTYDEAQALLGPVRDRSKYEQTFKAKYGDLQFSGGEKTTKEEREERWAFYQKALEEATTYPDLDVVLVDLLVPASQQSMGSRGYEHIGKEMCVGVFIGLLAGVKGVAKYIAVFTDSSHHDHPASACFDPFNWSRGGSEDKPVPFMVGEAKMLLCNNRNWIEEYDPLDFATPIEDDRPGTFRAKNWKALLEYLVSC